MKSNKEYMLDYFEVVKKRIEYLRNNNLIEGDLIGEANFVEKLLDITLLGEETNITEESLDIVLKYVIKFFELQKIYENDLSYEGSKSTIDKLEELEEMEMNSNNKQWKKKLKK